MEKKFYTIDATDGKLGRVASKVASLLMGKNLVSFAKNIVFNTEVKVVNASKLDISEKKQKTEYRKFSGYPGGLNTKTMEQLISKHGKGGLLKLTVKGMLPKNKLTSKIIKNLVITE